MKKKAKAKSGTPNGSSIDEERVILKPIFGVKPGVYLSVLYGAVLVLLLFFILVFPGLTRYGANVHFTSSPSGASILVDGVRVGATPFTTFVASGKHTMTFRKPYFGTIDTSVEVPGRAFFSLFVPAKKTVAAVLTLSDREALLKNAAERFASWALIGEAHGQYQFPPVLTNAVTDLYGGKTADTARPVPGAAAHLLDAALMNVQSSSLLRDYLHATSLDLSSGGIAGPLQLTQLFKKIIQYDKDTQGFPLWLTVVLSQDASSKLTKSAWFTSFLTKYRSEMRVGPVADAVGQIAGPERLVVGGIPFVRVDGGTFIMGQDEAAATSTDPLLVPSRVRVSGFYMMPTEVSRTMFERFLKADASWRPSHRAQLSASGVAGSGYLEGWGDAGTPPVATGNLPVTGVSYAAVSAFAAWLNRDLPASLSGYEIRLPTEAEWEYAARVNGSRSQSGVFQDTVAATPLGPQPVGSGTAGRLGIRDLMGNVWEWTAGWYRPAEPPLARKNASGDSVRDGIALADSVAASYPDAHRTVKGGSFANRSDSVSPASRGSMPSDWCTPYLGFRLVIAPKQ